MILNANLLSVGNVIFFPEPLCQLALLPLTHSQNATLLSGLIPFPFQPHQPAFGNTQNLLDQMVVYVENIVPR